MKIIDSFLCKIILILIVQIVIQIHILEKTSIGKKYKEGPYKNVDFETQCAFVLWIFHQIFVKI